MDDWPFPPPLSILGLCDGGGSNSSLHYIFKEDLQKLVDELGIEIRIAHYPPYCSKFNPIEHRLFPHYHPRLPGCGLYQCRFGQTIDREDPYLPKACASWSISSKTFIKPDAKWPMISKRRCASFLTNCFLSGNYRVNPAQTVI